MIPTDIVFIKPGSQRQIYGELSDFGLTAIEPPFWAAVLAGYMRELGYAVMLMDAEAEGWDYETAARHAIDAHPLLVVIIVSGTNPSASTMNMGGALKIAQKVKGASDCKTLLMGLHPSALPQTTLKEASVDFVCQGEGFYTLPSLMKALKAQSPVRLPIDGLWYKRDQHCLANPRPPLLANLDALPLPAWDLLPMTKYRAHNWHCFGHMLERQPYAVLYTSLGCPFNCSFCCINSFFGQRKIRFRGIEMILAELDFLVKTYRVRNIKIMDEMFALNEDRTIAICDAIAERGYNLNMWAYARVDTVTDKMLVGMKKAGIHWLAYGFESGNQHVLNQCTKGYTLDRVSDIVEKTYGIGIHICANYILGMPHDDFSTMHDTLDLMLKINAEWANIYCAMAYPGSRLYEMALESGWKLPETWVGYSQYNSDTLPLSTNYLSSGEVLGFRDHAFQIYYRNPAYLNRIAKIFGVETVSSIKQMTAKKIKRKYAVPYAGGKTILQNYGK